SAAQRRRGVRPPAAGPAWSAKEDRAVQTQPPREAAAKTGRTLQAVYDRRHELKLPDGRAKNRRAPRTDGWTGKADKVVRALSAKEAAARTGRSLQAVYSRRHDLKVPDGRVHNGGYRR